MSVIVSSRRPTLAVVVPTLNEEAALAATLQSLHAQIEPAERLLVVDGGSCDGTEAVARSLGAEFLMMKPGQGRGGQIARGVAQVGEEVVLVAHADMRFPPQALQAIRDHLQRWPTCPGGCLGHRFDSPRWIYRVIEWFDRRRGQRGDSYGDQAQFFRREALASVNGFPNQPIMEDVELARRLKRLGRPAYLDLPVTVSPRRFEQRGIVRVGFENWYFRRIYKRRGLAACADIYRAYYAKRKPA